MEATQLITVPDATLEHLLDGQATPVAKGTVALNLVNIPSSQSAPPAYTPASSSSSSSKGGPPPLPPRQQYDQWLVLTLTEAGASEPVVELPIPATTRILTLPNGGGYVIPASVAAHEAFTGVSSTGKGKADESESGFIKLSMSPGTDVETRELFENVLWGMASFSSPQVAPSSLAESGRKASDHDLRSRLVLVDEDNGSVLGELETGIQVSEEAALGREQQGDHEKEPVVIEVGEGTTSAPNGLITVKALSSWQATPNPQGSKIITGANFISQGIITGAGYVSKGLEMGADKFVKSVKPAEQPLVFSPRTQGTAESSHRFTSKAVQISGKTVGVIGNMAMTVGDRVGKTLGIQTTPSGKQPTGVRGVVNRSLIAFNAVLDSVETGGKAVLETGFTSATTAIGHRYGSDAAAVSSKIGGSVKHVALVYIDARGVTRKALLKSVGKSAIRAKLADGREVILSEQDLGKEDVELQNLASSGAAEKMKKA